MVGSPRLIELAAESSSASVLAPQIQTVKRMASGPLGTVSRRFPWSAVCHFNPPDGLDTKAATIAAALDVMFCRCIARTPPLPDASAPLPVRTELAAPVGAAPGPETLPAPNNTASPQASVFTLRNDAGAPGRWATCNTRSRSRGPISNDRVKIGFAPKSSSPGVSSTAVVPTVYDKIVFPPL